MAEKHNFRSAFNGFHREDVVKYIEFITSKHNTQVNQLTAENDQLRTKLARAESTPAQDPLTLEMLAHAESQRDDYAARLESQSAELDALKARCAELEQQVSCAVTPEEVQARLAEQEAAHQAQLAQVKAEADARVAAAMAQVASLQSKADRELEAYRRAERTERMARERAEQVYHQANGALADASAHVEQAAGQIGNMADQVIAQLEQLRTAVTGSKDALRAAADTLYTIRPTAEEE